MATPYFRTAKKTKERIRTVAAMSTPKHVVHAITTKEGGEMEARGSTLLVIGSRLQIFDEVSQSQRMTMCCTAECLSIR